ncbi:MFS transporter [Oceanobacillus oncorhynchi subsp. oncorhynchi]|uniref:MFS transporter n=1 Tax=Oceanobacillus oncorhynchi TaxID=545501 RepID=UPI0031DC842F
MKEKKKFHYAWVVLIVCCMINFAGLGTIFNTSGIFFPSVTKELGIGTGDMSLYMTFLCLAMFVASPLVAKLLPKIDVRITLSVAFVVALSAIAAMSLYTEIWQWYLSGIVIGFAGAFIFYIPIPVIVQNWFHKKTGVALGIIGAFTGIGGAIMNPVIASFIDSFGWRTAYVITAIIIGVIVLPFTIFVLRFKPEDKGYKPYGYAETLEDQETFTKENEKGVPVKVAITSLAFFCVIIIASFSGLISGLNQLLTSYGNTVGLTTTAAATLVSASMISNLLTKFLFGAASDKFGVKMTLIVSVLLIAFGFSLFFISHGTYATVFTASLLYGIHASVIIVGLPLITKELFGKKHFVEIFSYVTMGQALVKSFGFAVFGYMYDLSNSYEPAFMLGIVICVLMAVLTVGAFRSRRKMEIVREKEIGESMQ